MALFLLPAASAQDSARFQWTIKSERTSPNHYTLHVQTAGKDGWQIYAPDADFGSDIKSLQLVFSDSSIRLTSPVRAEGKGRKIKSSIFEN
jgi:hypothetical protein